VHVALALSLLAHAGAVAWWPLHSPATEIAAVVPPMPASPEAAPTPTPAPPAEPIVIMLVDPDVPLAPAEPTRGPPRARTSPATHALVATHSQPASETSASGVPEAPPAAPPRNPLMTMRHPGDDLPRPSDVTIDLPPSRGEPAAPEQLPEERIADELAAARRAGDWERVVALRDEQRALDLHPSSRGTYEADKTGFDMRVAPDGTVHFHDKPTFDLTDALMRATGSDPYAAEKLRVLDRTRDARVILARRSRHEQLSHSAMLVQGHIDRLWAKTSDLATRKQILFELWDDCAEPADDTELAAGADAARATVIGWIQLKLTGADAYTLDELARLNAHRHSRRVFAPYADP
jgi:hypothetical protein